MKSTDFPQVGQHRVTIAINVFNVRPSGQKNPGDVPSVLAGRRTAKPSCEAAYQHRFSVKQT